MSLQVIERIFELFHQRGTEQYGSEAVTQLQHAIQAAILAQREQAESHLVAAALLHDVGHILGNSPLPDHESQNFDDHHENRAYPWLLEHFGKAVADPVRLHVAAKRYLCTVEPEYAAKLSPTSLKSYFDQGGPMSVTEQIAFEQEEFYSQALRLRRWDDRAKDPSVELPSIESFGDLLRGITTA
ncbi:MAG: HD domain-containing protein [Planctomycetaceae bacterium]|nr:HD domain-containing protein [Planctomycetaceae bacterium]